MNRKHKSLAAAVLAAICAVCLPAHLCQAAEPVINMRNNGTGAYPNADPPLVWSAVKNVKWRWEAPLLGSTISSAIIVGDRIVTLARPVTIVCLDKNTGEVLWLRKTHLGSNGGTTSVSSANATERVPPQAQEVKAMHAAIMRDFRMLELEMRGAGGKKSSGGKAELSRISTVFAKRPGEIDRLLRKLRRRKAAGVEDVWPAWASDKEAEYFARRAKAFEALKQDGAENKEAYEKEFEALKAQRPGKREPGYTAEGYVCGATPVSDGERIVALFQPGLAVCYDLDGKLLWTHAVSRDGRNPGMGAAVCPAMGDGKVVLDCGSIMRCLNAEDGSVVWSRDCKKIRRSFGWGAASPVIGHAGGVYYFMCHQGDVCRLDTGKVVVPCEWKVNPDLPKHKLDRYWQNSISADRKTFHAISHAVRIPDDPAKPAYLLWHLTAEQLDVRREDRIFGSSHNYAAPMIDDGKVYVYTTGGKGTRSVLDAETGKVLVGPVIGCPQPYSVPIYAGGLIYRFHGKIDGGKCEIRDPKKEFELVQTNTLEPGLNMEPLFEGRRMYVRTDLSLYCIEKPEDGKPQKETP